MENKVKNIYNTEENKKYVSQGKRTGWTGRGFGTIQYERRRYTKIYKSA